MDFPSLAPHPPGLHSLSTTGAQAPSSVHTMWMPPPAEASLRCRAMSQTPTYDQLRGERINADVPADEADPQQIDHVGRHRLVDHFGRHRLVDDALGVAVCGQPPGSGADLTDWPSIPEADPKSKLDCCSCSAVRGRQIRDRSCDGERR
jgi:hypothetical protein